MAYKPHRRRGRAIGSSSVFKWLLMDDPDPHSALHRGEVDGLADALRAAGWEPIEPGIHWYSERFVWRQETPPPDLDHSRRHDADTATR